MALDSSLLWQMLVLGSLIGFGVGFAVAYWIGKRDDRAGALRAELQEQEARFAAFRREVDAHFVQTSELFQDLTERHRSMYEHLAQGAQALCSEELLAQRLAVVERRLRLEQRTPAGEVDPAIEEPAEAVLGAEATGTPAQSTDSMEAADASDTATGSGQRNVGTAEDHVPPAATTTQARVAPMPAAERPEAEPPPRPRNEEKPTLH